MSTLDVVGLRDFYATPLGRMVKRILRARIQARWDNVVGLTVLGLGYATPFLNPFRADALRTMAFMPAEQGVVHWPRKRTLLNRSCRGRRPAAPRRFG